MVHVSAVRDLESAFKYSFSVIWYLYLRVVLRSFAWPSARKVVRSCQRVCCPTTNCCCLQGHKSTKSSLCTVSSLLMFTSQFQDQGATLIIKTTLTSFLVIKNIPKILNSQQSKQWVVHFSVKKGAASNTKRVMFCWVWTIWTLLLLKLTEGIYFSAIDMTAGWTTSTNLHLCSTDSSCCIIINKPEILHIGSASNLWPLFQINSE